MPVIALLSSPNRPVDRALVASPVANRVRLFGGAAVDTSVGPITGRAAQRHRIALLALLSTTWRLHRSRDQLIAFLWPDANAEHGRKLLSDSIYRVNHALGGEAIIGTGEDIRLNRLQVGSDVADFEAAVDAREWRRAVDLYAGPFLDGFYLPNAADFDQWMEGERTQYARRMARATEALAVAAAEEGRAAEAVEWWHRLAALVPEDSRVAGELMRALDAAGNRAGALRHARVHALLLRETLGVEPDRSVQELADEIARRSDAPAIAAAVVVHAAAPGASAPWSAAAAATGAAEPLADAGTDHGVEAPTPRGQGRETPPTPRSVATQPRETDAGTRSVAVLPFNNLSESGTDAYFADGVSDELTYLLTRTPGLRVASRTSAFACRDLKLDVREVARRLDVDWILEGSVRRAGNILRIVVQLTDAGNGYQVWSESFNRTASDIFAIQEEIAVAVARRLASPVDAAVTVQSTGGPADPDTYDVYLQARFQWHRRTELSLARSAGLLEQVVAHDPGYPRAWAGLADTYAVMAFHDYLAPQVAFPRAEDAARRAMQLDATLAAPHATIAYVDTYYHWRWDAAEQGFCRAIELEPTNATAHQWYACLLAARGRFDEAERTMRRAAELEPLSLVANSALGWVLLLAGQEERAIRQLAGALQLDADFPLARYWMGLAHLQAGRPLDAIACLDPIKEPSDGCPQVMQVLARAHAAAGNTREARTMLAALLQRENAGRYISSCELAKVHLALGDVPAALDRLERAYTDRAHALANLQVDPQLRPLAGEARFRRLVEQVG
jgi:TolB-like protein/DNA-binding SARP family transcriptional activator